MLKNEDIDLILEQGLAELGMVGGVIGGASAGSLTTAAVSVLTGGSGAKIGARKIATDHKNETIVVKDDIKTSKLIRQFFGEGNFGVDANNENYVIGLRGSGFWNMNPCVYELVQKPGELNVTTHAKEGLIKQNSCQKAIDNLKSYLSTN